MRRDEIDLTVEYCETAPHAYGAEPRVTPNQLRFLSLEPYTWVHTWEVVPYVTEHIPAKEGRTTIKETGTPVAMPVQQARKSAHTAYVDRFSYARTLKPGAAFSTWDQSIKGHLLAERKRGDTWHQVLAQPAAVHRTWSAHLAEKGERDAARHATKVKQAPRNFRNAVQEAIENAVLILDNLPGDAKTSHQDIRLFIDEEIRKQVDGG